jgi:hypothetical protein
MAGEHTEACGCRWRRKYDIDTYLKMCDEHRPEHDALHEQALADRRAKELESKDGTPRESAVRPASPYIMAA